LLVNPIETARLCGVRYLFLDRDGVIVPKLREGKYLTRPSDVELLPAVSEAIARVNRAGITTVVVTNQRGIALGLLTASELNAIHLRVQDLLLDGGARIDAFFFCPHDNDECDCRKPKPGMFLDAFQRYPAATASNSVIVGDSLSDIQAGANLGMRTIYISGDPLLRKPGAEAALKLATASTDSLVHAVDLILLTR
jgi:D-glycero-D-manno-heptose 1,7-bisphosphate phosphatase